MTTNRRTAATLAATAGLFAFAAPGLASAADRYAAADGGGTECTAGQPCTLQTAYNKAGDGDRVLAAAGTYELANALLDAKGSDVELRGAPNLGTQIRFTAGRLVVDAGGDASDLDIRAAGNTPFAVDGYGTAQRVHVTATLSDAAACTVGSGLLENVSCYAEGPTSIGVLARTTNMTGVRTAALVHVSAEAAGVGTVGLKVQGLDNTDATYSVTAFNAIAMGDAYDVQSSRNGGSASTVIAKMVDSAWNANYTSGGATVAQEGMRLTLRPKTLTGGLTGLHAIAPDSPTIDLANPAHTPTTTDVFGKPRVSGGAPDLGAFEYQAKPVAPPVEPGTPETPQPPTTGDGTDLPPVPQPTTQAQAPSTTAPTAPPRATSPAASGPALTALRTTSAKVRRRGTLTLTGRLSAAATVTVKVERVRPGGRTTVVGTQTTAAKAGAVRIALRGRLTPAKLGAGRYRATVTPRNAAGAGAPGTVAFRVVG